MLLAGVGNGLRTVTFGNHNHGTAVVLEQVNVRVHTSGCRGTEAPGCHTFGCLGGTGVIDRVFLEIFRHGFARVEHRFDLGVRDIACHD